MGPELKIEQKTTFFIEAAMLVWQLIQLWHMNKVTTHNHTDITHNDSVKQ